MEFDPLTGDPLAKAPKTLPQSNEKPSPPPFVPSSVTSKDCAPEEMLESARAKTPLALETLVYLAENAQFWPAVARAAAADLLDRGFGKPKQSASLDVEVNVSLAALLDRAEKRVLGIIPPSLGVDQKNLPNYTVFNQEIAEDIS